METHHNDTWIAAVPFADGADRRKSPRVPCSMRVRLGPPKDQPETTLMAEDLSTGGIFIRCGQAVQVGARFSVELEMDGGERVYVPEAEVLYNYSGEADGKRGFGARFVSLTREVLTKLNGEARFDSDLAVPPASDRPGSALPATDSMIISTRAKSETTDEVPRERSPRTVAIDLREAIPRVSDLRLASLRPAFTAPPLAAAAEGAIDDAIYRFSVTARPMPIDDTAPIDTVEAEPEREEEADIHDGIDWKPREVRELEGRWWRHVSWGSRAALWCAGGAAGVVVMLVGASLVSTGDDGAAIASRPAPRVSAEIHRALTESRPAPLPAPTSAAPRVPAPVPAAPPVSPLVALDRQAEAAATLTSAAPTKPAPASAGAGLALQVEPGARVLRTHVLKQPDRFVIDLAGQKTAPKVVASGGFAAPRIGLHPDYVRVVIDSPRRLEQGFVSIKDGRLEVRLR